MYLGPLPYQSPVSMERGRRREGRRIAKAQGKKYPRLRTIVLVELDVITCPEWAWHKAVKGLTRTDKSIWLRRILARTLAREDEDAGGQPKLTFTQYRPCNICKRALLGVEAEHRWSLDRKFEGARIPCSPECTEIEFSRLQSRSVIRN